MSQTKVPYPVYAVFCDGSKKERIFLGYTRRRLYAFNMCANYSFEKGGFTPFDAGGCGLYGEPTSPNREWRVCVRATDANTEAR